MQNIVLIGGHDQAVNRQPHTLGNIACKNITKVACWHCKADLALRGAQTGCRREIIHNLRQYPRPVNRIYAGQTHLISEGKVVEHLFKPRLAGIKIAIHRQSVDIAFAWRCHLPALNL